jgi:hypothetical protein
MVRAVLARLSVLCVFVALLAAVAGCGGGGSSTGGSSSQSSESGKTTKAAFIEEADAACGEYQAEVLPIKAELEEGEKVAEPESPENLKNLGELLNEARADSEANLEELRELDVPAGDEATIEKLLDTAPEGDVLAGEGATALEEGDIQTFGKLAQEGEALNNRATKMAESYGLKVCGQAP